MPAANIVDYQLIRYNIFRKLKKDKKRDKVRVEMIRENIYCPVHWPINKNYPYQQTSYHDKELSLICDQRYGEEDIEHEIEVLRKAISG